jgi:multidrug efflux pump subunit AcrA (membrane-fusion protein)
VVDRVLISEGQRVGRGAPLAKLRDTELLARRSAAVAAQAGSERLAALAAARGQVAEERMLRSQAASYGQEIALLSELIAGTTVRAPVSGVVLTPRPEDRVGARLQAGDLVVAIGRTDTLELDLGVDQRDIGRVEPGQRVRLRVDALPGRTFRGTVTLVGPAPRDTSGGVSFPVRALVPNEEGLLRPGMAAHARVLTGPASLAVRLLRGPVRWARLALWRLFA